MSPCGISKRNLAVLSALLLVLGAAALRGQSRASGEWKQLQRLQLELSGWVRIPVPLATLDACRPGLEDLRLLDAGVKELPYLLERPATAKSAWVPSLDFAVSLRSDATVALFANPERHPVDQVQLESAATEFLKSSRLEASADGIRWQTVADAVPLYRQPDGRSGMQIRFPAGSWSRFRLTLDDRREPAVPVTGARLHTAPWETPELLPLGLRVAERTEEDGATHLRILADGANVVLGRLELETPEPLFSRSVDIYARRLVEGEIHELLIASGQIYRTEAGSAGVPLRIDTPDTLLLPAREFILCIRNADSPPLQLLSAKAWRYPVYLTFESKAPGAFVLLSGNPSCAAPRYDLAGLQGKLKARAVEPDALSGLEPNPAYQAAGQAAGFPEAAGGIDLAGWAYRKRVKAGTAGMQQLELDLDVLARTGSSLRDLRLVRSGKQVPYLVERTLQRRYLPLALEPGTGRPDPRLSRWSLSLPRKNLPLEALSLDTDATLFRRSVRLYDDAPEAGRRDLRLLASTQ